ncbi:MAG: hypothetical protein V2A55_00385 [Candidatus Jorgensenbacteria bacterium]
MKTLLNLLWWTFFVINFGGCSPSGEIPPTEEEQQDSLPRPFDELHGGERWSVAKLIAIVTYDKDQCRMPVTHFLDLLDVQRSGHHRLEAAVRIMPNFDEVLDRHAIALGKMVFAPEVKLREDDPGSYRRHLFHLRAETYEHLLERRIPFDSLGVTKETAREMILASGNDHIRGIFAGNYDGEEDEYDVAAELIWLRFSPRQISAFPPITADSVSKGLR